MNTKEVQDHLRALGWDNVDSDGSYGPITRASVYEFQRGFAFWNIHIDGEAGPETWAALRHAMATGGKTSDHFKFVEFRCKCGGRYKSCARIKLNRETVRGLEVYRSSIGRGVAIISGYRCTNHNRAVGGASRSRHLYGDAADVSPVQHYTRTARLRRFTGIGYQGGNGLTRHVDLRPGNVSRPTTWRY